MGLPDRYVPGRSAIETRSTRIKTGLHDMQARASEALDTALPKVIGTISDSDTSVFHTHCGCTDVKTALHQRTSGQSGQDRKRAVFRIVQNMNRKV